MDNLEELRAATASLEQSSGYTLFDTPLPLSPPLACQAGRSMLHSLTLPSAV